MWSDGGKEDRHGVRRFINKDELFQLANLERTLEEGHSEVNSNIPIVLSFNRTKTKKSSQS